jgi:hypothetical protein
VRAWAINGKNCQIRHHASPGCGGLRWLDRFGTYLKPAVAARSVREKYMIVREVGTSREQFHRRIRALLGLSQPVGCWNAS